MCMQGKDAAGASYCLVGIVEHRGSMAAGHYSSYIARQPGTPSPEPQPSSPEQEAKPAGRSKRENVAAAAALTPTPTEAAQTRPQPEGHADKEQVGEACDTDNTAALKAAKVARSAPQQSLAGGWERLAPEEMLWFHASDAHVKLVSWEQAASCEPYLLMYVRTR